MKCVVSELKADLIIPLPGCAVRDCIGVSLACDLDLTFSDEGSCDTGPKEVLTLVDGIGTEHREYIVTYELFTEILDVDLLHTQLLSLSACRLNLLTLTDVGGECDDIALVRILKPLQDD